MWQTFGHEQIKKILSLQLQSQRLSHAYLFKGPDGVGKKALALEFARKILGAESLNNHPDFQILDSQSEILIEQALEFISKIHLKPFLGKNRVAIINNAENLNVQSSNALLKTLEEPSDSAIIILISSTESLLPTIVSRCQSFNFSLFSKTELAEIAQALNLKTDEKILQLGFGRVSRLKRLAEDRVYLRKEQEAITKYDSFVSKSLSEKLAAVSQLAELEDNELSDSLHSWLMWQIQSLDKEPEDFLKVAALVDALAGLKKNLNKKLVIQKLLMNV